MGYFKKKEIEQMDNYKLREAEDFEDNVDTPVQDTSFSIEHEKHLNKNNIIFHTNKYQKLYQKMKKVDDKLISIIFCHSSFFILNDKLSLVIPALLIKISSPPTLEKTFSINSSIFSCSLISNFTVSIFG